MGDLPTVTRFGFRGFRGAITFLDRGEVQIHLVRAGEVVYRSTWAPCDRKLVMVQADGASASFGIVETIKSVAAIALSRCNLFEHRLPVVDDARKPLTDLAGALAFLVANPGGALFSTGGYSDRGDDELVTDASDGWTGVYRVTPEVKAMLRDLGAVERNSYRGFKQYRALYAAVPAEAARLLPDAETIAEGRRLGMTFRAFEMHQDEHEKRERARRLRRESRARAAASL